MTAAPFNPFVVHTLTEEELHLSRPPKDAIDLFIVELVHTLGYRKAHIMLFGYEPRPIRTMPNGDPVETCKVCGLAIHGMGDMADFAWYEVEDGGHRSFGEDGHDHEPETL